MRPYSVLMSVYEKEQAEYFDASIESMLCQSVPPSDFVIVCDGALTAELDAVLDRKIKEHPGLFQIIRKPRCEGIGNALSLGLLSCKHELVARMDSDDISRRDRCEKEIAALEHLHCSVVGSNIVEFEGNPGNTKSRRSVPETNEQIRKFAKRRNPFNHPSVLFRKSHVLKAGNYLECKGFEDYYLWVRMLRMRMVGYNIQEDLLYMRTDAGMYARRGGWRYVPQVARGRYRILKTGYISPWDFIVTMMGQMAVTCTPVKLRKALYRAMLREKT